jgi:hypothetical protein
MATKKSQPAKKQAAKKAVKKAPAKKANKAVAPATVSEATESVVSKETQAPAAATQPAPTTSYSSPAESQDEGIFLKLIVVLGAFVIAYVAYNKITGKKMNPAVPSTANSQTEAPASVPEKVEQSAPAGGFFVDKIERNKTFDEATEYCASLNAKLPTKEQLIGLDAKIPDSMDLKDKTQFWTSSLEGNKAVWVRFDNNSSGVKSKKNKFSVLCSAE